MYLIQILYVNHINSKRDDNDYRNLEWVTQVENIDHAYKHGGLAKKRKPVIQCDEHFNEIQRFESVSAAARAIRGDHSGIHQVCQGKMQHYHGFKWKYADAVVTSPKLTLNIVDIKTLYTINISKHLTLCVKE